jgi:hypothetical protein
MDVPVGDEEERITGESAQGLSVGGDKRHPFQLVG